MGDVFSLVVLQNIDRPDCPSIAIETVQNPGRADRVNMPAGDRRSRARAWANAIDQYDARWPEAFRLVQNEGTGLLITGTRDWIDYTVSSTIVQ